MRYIVVNHRTYTAWGIPARVALHSGATVLCKNEAHLRRIESTDELLRHDLMLSLTELDDLIERVGIPHLRAYGKEKFGISIGTNASVGRGDNILDQEAKELRVRLGAEDKPLAVIPAHCFSPAPHCDREMIYRDYFQWLTQLLKLTSKIQHVRWAVKRHPYAPLYDEAGIVEHIVAQHNHVALIDRNITKETILRAADAVVSVRSAMAIEALLFDCRVILAGNAWYDNNESIEVYRSEKSLYSALQSIDRGAKIAQEEKMYALAILYYEIENYNYETPLVGTHRLVGTTAEESLRKDKEDIMEWASYLSNRDYRGDAYYQAVLGIFSITKGILFRF